MRNVHTHDWQNRVAVSLPIHSLMFLVYLAHNHFRDASREPRVLDRVKSLRMAKGFLPALTNSGNRLDPSEVALDSLDAHIYNR